MAVVAPVAVDVVVLAAVVDKMAAGGYYFLGRDGWLMGGEGQTRHTLDVSAGSTSVRGQQEKVTGRLQQRRDERKQAKQADELHACEGTSSATLSSWQKSPRSTRRVQVTRKTAVQRGA